MSAWVSLVLAAALAASHGAALLYGRHLEAEHVDAVKHREERVAKVAGDAAAEAAASAIRRMKVQHVTLRQEVETRVRDDDVYRDCRIDPVSMRNINAIRTGEPSAPVRELPAAAATDR
jgi:hypothetical protein